MEKRIFALYGVSNVGKSTTLRLIAQEIMRQFPAAVSSMPLDPLPEGDIVVIILVGKVKIGITTQGDPSTGLYQRLKDLFTDDCSIIFCATRTSGDTIKNVEDMEKNNGYKTTWVTNYQSGYPEDRSILNQRSAEDLVRLMRGFCKI